jgi:hypothetical protein
MIKSVKNLSKQVLFTLLGTIPFLLFIGFMVALLTFPVEILSFLLIGGILLFGYRFGQEFMDTWDNRK